MPKGDVIAGSATPSCRPQSYKRAWPTITTSSTARLRRPKPTGGGEIVTIEGVAWVGTDRAGLRLPVRVSPCPPLR